MFTKTATAIAALVAFSAPALSADIYQNGGTKDAPYAEPAGKPAFVGLGVGVQGGGQFTNVEIADKGFSFDGVGADGIVGGLHVEYLFALGRYRAGFYAEGGLSNVNTNIEVGGADVDLLNQEHYYGGGIKAGATAFGSSLIYARAGIERAKWEFAEEIDVTVDSVVLGGGVETMIASNVSLGLGVDYLIPFNIEADGDDLTEFLDETESFRAMARITWRQ